MILNYESFPALFHRLAAYLTGKYKSNSYNDKGPLRAELFSADRMEQHGRDLAETHCLSSNKSPDQLLARLAENERILLSTCKLISDPLKKHRRITPAGEWLLDNFYLIEEQIRTAKHHLPKNYSRELPRLEQAPSVGLPRVYDIALEAIAHGDGLIDPESLDRFVVAYQKITPLKLGELWAIPIMLRLALIENLRRVAARIAASAINRDLANSWADKMSEAAKTDPKSLILVIADMARSTPPMVSPFVAELARCLQGQSSALAMPLTWIEQRLVEEGTTIEQLVQAENQSQAADQVSIGNSIGSLRFLGAADWRKFVETMSVVEHKLLEDPAGIYGKMDFATRDRYRHAIEKIARIGRLSEGDVARKAIQLANDAGVGIGDTRGFSAGIGAADGYPAHVGYYLIDKGLPQLEAAVGVRWSVSQTIFKICRRYTLLLYLGTILALTAIFTWSFLVQANAIGLHRWPLVLVGLIVTLCASQLAVAMANWLATFLTTPQLLPRLDFSEGIPINCRTLTVVPTLLVHSKGVEDLLEGLEVRYLANRDPNLHFGLLTDYQDAAEQSLPADRPLLIMAQSGIEALNIKYRDPENHLNSDPFFLFHRPRRWNAQESIWMGYERKRGKLAELNGLLRGSGPDKFELIVGATQVLTTVKYVITLDTDTQLPRDSAKQFIGAMAHPLNHPRFGKSSSGTDSPRVIHGYGILQPRVAVSLPSTNNSRFARLFGSDPGIDPYTRAVSDVYQDLFGEGSFIGKGIYDVDAFEQALKGRFPENRILSHDLLEGCYARSGLLSDVQLYEAYPARYSADVARRHRWIRGDWQIASWLLAKVPSNGSSQQNPLSILSQWKIFDNLRRSLFAPGLTLLLILGWTCYSRPYLWTMALLGIVLIPALCSALLTLLIKSDEVTLRQNMATTLQAVRLQLAQAIFTIACLPYEAYFSINAIIRIHWRLKVTKNNLLEWAPSGSPQSDNCDGMAICYRSMWVAPVISIVLTFYLAAVMPSTLIVAGSILMLWMASPAIVWWTSQPLDRRKTQLTSDQVIFLRKIARKTWAFFETFVTLEDHWLPPDNYQEQPVNAVAHRTSPTNMGLALLANLSAYDFGYIAAGPLIERTANAFDTMKKLERHQGHFYNWYDTLSLKPLQPLYVSSVDSGNLAAHLLTLRAGLLLLADQPIFSIRFFEGLTDTLRVLIDATEKINPAATLQMGAMSQLQKDIDSAYDSRPTTVVAMHHWLNRFAMDATEIARGFEQPPELAGSMLGAKEWALALSKQCCDMLDELHCLIPWLAMPAAPIRLQAAMSGETIPTLRTLADVESKWITSFEKAAGSNPTPEECVWLSELRGQMSMGSSRAQARLVKIEGLVLQADALAHMQYGFLYDKARHLLSIGYNATERRLDTCYYDLLASEARLTTFVTIAQEQLPQESWFALGRRLTNSGGTPVLLSWSGSMFEYLMPLLVMPTYENTLLDQTYRGAVARQIAYGKQCGVAWGMSECCYNAFDDALNYQYRAFGVPSLGFKRGLADDLVIAPYASVLALMVEPEAACVNLERLAREGLTGKFGLYDAVDYTLLRLPRGQKSAVVRSFMAHHQGMSLLALSYQLLGCPMQKRFESDPQFQATLLLLQERVPKIAALQTHTTQIPTIIAEDGSADMAVRVLASPNTEVPEVQLLSNGRYHVMVTNAGGGYSRWHGLAVTRWREDSTCDNWGMFCYIRDVKSGVFWSNAHQPALRRADHYEAIFSQGRAEYRRRDLDYDTHTEIVVSPEDDIELRRMRIINRAQTRRTIDITSYAEVVLAAPAADATQPAFSNLFVQTEIVAEHRAILCRRRPRSTGESVPWMLHLMTAHGASVENISFETDRLQFLGRGRTIVAPQAMNDTSALSGSAGSVLDPIVAIRNRITLEPEQTVIIDLVSGIADTRDAALGLIGKYQDKRLADRVIDLAATHSGVTLRQINASEADAQLYSRLASSILYTNSALRADAEIIIKNLRNQSSLWGYTISGDLPIVLLQIGDQAHIDLVRQVVQAHTYWRQKGLAVDLVIWNEDHAGYRQLLHEQIMGLIAAGVQAHVIDKPGGIFVRRVEQISVEDRVLLQAVASIILSDRYGTLKDQINRRTPQGSASHLNMPRLMTRDQLPLPPAEPTAKVMLPRPDLMFENGLGGFAADGREYVTTTSDAKVTPAPWVNVLANSHFGTVISESGGAYTWSENARMFRMTPWANDAVTDTSGEAFYLRDEDSGRFWSPMPLPSRGAEPYLTRHGFGYSVFEHTEDGIATTLCVYVDLEVAVKYSVLKIRNLSGRTRRLSATGYVEWVLGDLRPKCAMHVITEIDPVSGTLYARNAYNTEFSERTAFFDLDEPDRTYTGDRTEFLGRNGTLSHPAAMSRARLSNKVGAALDPCAAIQVMFELSNGEERELVYRLGAGLNAGDAQNLAQLSRGLAVAHDALIKVRQYWDRTLGTVQIETPDKSLDVLANGWLVYQTLACRMWARSGFYQSGGAFGFRDQLQDVMALIHIQPKLVREHLLRCAARQFLEGDVQHWWHPKSGRGVRTHCSDDYLWLPLAICQYVKSTGDTGVLDESVHFLEGRLVNPEEESYYDLPNQSEQSASLYEHAVRAILRGLNFGEHGIPLMGSGDWNDGMNLVGAKGKGESVWLGFFLYEVLMQFTTLAQHRNDTAFAERCQREAAQLRRNIEQSGWDGEWYRRAYFDDGTALGSSEGVECQIDAIAQSWAVLSNAGDPIRVRTAMIALDRRLVRRDHGLIQLLDPPFDKSSLNPGYIKGYVPGVRENGGQYTHAAIWTVMAFAKLGDRRRAWELFDLINPVNHASSAEKIARYKVEPYVVAADVYASRPHIGRGGWTWYTGSAGWLYRLIIESLVGLKLEVDKLRLTPCLPEEWKAIKVHYRFRETLYHIAVVQLPDANSTAGVTVDGVDQQDYVISLVDDRQDHVVEVRLPLPVQIQQPSNMALVEEVSTS